MTNDGKMQVCIIGSGNIGADLLVKVMRSPFLECSLFAGRNLNSPGMKFAKDLGIRISDKGIDAVIDDPLICDLVFDATSAQAHKYHWKILSNLGKRVIDMTPAKLGEFCIPSINPDIFTTSDVRNINMVTCGGQSSIPIAYAISKIHADIEYIEVASSIASLSAGPATRSNLDEYIETTEDALSKFTGAKRSKAILILNPANPPIDMQTTIYAKISAPDISAIRDSVHAMVTTLKSYVPGYELLVPPTFENGRVVTTIKVKGNGDYLPQYAGNLDIINCAALSVAETIAKEAFSVGELV